jgi:dTDP-4-amino-4,6-dideoxygalactose transaminase
LANVHGIQCLGDSGETISNYAYFPILVKSDYPISRDDLYQKLKDQDIFARRYFYPLISNFPMYREMQSASPENLPVAEVASQQVLCLPIYPALTNEEQTRIIEVIKRVVA